jgi:hypothetical protein
MVFGGLPMTLLSHRERRNASGSRDAAPLGPTSGLLLSKSVSNEKGKITLVPLARVLKTKQWPVNMAHPETIPRRRPPKTNFRMPDKTGQNAAGVSSR